MIRLSLLSTMLWTACRSDESVKILNANPEITIVSHDDESPLREGEVNLFRAQVSDPNHDSDELEVAWYVGSTQLCDWTPPTLEGESYCEAALTEEGNLIAEVRDPEGAGGVDALQMSVMATEAPLVSWEAPNSNGVYYSDILIELAALVSDAEDAPEELQATLSSSIDGELGLDLSISSAGELSGGTFLSEGQHVLTLMVEDSMGKSGSDVVTIAVGPPNTAPSCEILEPINNTPFIFGDPVQFTALVGDIDISADALSVEWSSDKDGEIGNSSPTTAGEVVFSTTDLTRDVHTITMTVRDELGATCSDLVQISVGEYPSISWTAPAEQSIHTEVAAVSLSVLVSDPEDRAEELSVSWTSSIDGLLGTLNADGTGEAKWTLDSLSVGPHTITAQVTDLNGLSSTASLGLVIDGAPSAPAVGIDPPAAHTEDDLVASASGATDPEGSSISYGYLWQENGIDTSYTTSVLPSAATEKGDVWTVVVTPNDGLQDGATGSASITIGNANPSITAIAIDPSQPLLNDTLNCSVTASDPDGETLTASHAWLNQSSGQALGSGETLTLDGSIAQPGDLLLCVVTVTDPDGATDSNSGNVTVANTPPSLSDLQITPSSPRVIDAVSCSGLVTEPDAQGYTLSAEWFVGNVFVGAGLNLDLSTVSVSKGDTLRCELTATDDSGDSTQEATSVIVVNSAPIDNGLSIQPTPPTMTDIVSCNYAVTDPDNDVLTMDYSWTDSSGIDLGAAQTLDLSQGSFQPGDILTCTASATDSEGEQVTANTSESIANTAPSVSNVAISPSPTVGSIVGCTADIFDPDNQALTITYSWLNDSTGQSLGTSASVLLPSSAVTQGDSISCEVTVVDPDGETAVGTATAVVVNTPPQISQLQINPTQPAASDTLLCSALVTDADGDSTSSSIEWFDDSSNIVGSGASLDLIPLNAQLGDSFTCSFTATDSSGDSSNQSVSVTVVDGPPVISSVTLSPSQPFTDSVVTANVVASDPEGQSISLTYEWAVDGITMTETAAQISGVQYFDKNQTLSVTVTPSDGINQGVSVTESVGIENSLPLGLSIRLEPTTPRHLAQDLICEISSPSTDADGDSVSYSFNWFVNGQSYAGTPLTTYRSGDTIAASELEGGLLWRCEVTPNDGQDDGLTEGVEVDVLPAFVDVAVGSTYSCGLDAAGTVSCWGAGSTAANAPVGTFEDIEAGVQHACAQNSAGILTCWGTNHSGSTVAPSVAFDDFSMGYNMTCAVQSNNQALDCWGNTTDGRANPPSGSFAVVNGGLSSTCALRSSDGVTQCWGENDYNKSSPPSTSFVDVSVGYNTVCGLTSAGSISCWGRNHAGQFNVPAGTWIDLSVGDTHVCGLNAAGTVICWGDNTLGQSTPPSNETFSQVEVAVFHSCALTDDGRILCWGDDSNGQLSEF